VFHNRVTESTEVGIMLSGFLIPLKYKLNEPFNGADWVK